MLPTLQKLTLNEVNLQTLPETFVFPSLQELEYSTRISSVINDNIKGISKANISELSNRLLQLAPGLQTLQWKIHLSRKDDNIWKLTTPPTVTKLVLSVNFPLNLYKSLLEPVPFVISPNIKHIELCGYANTLGCREQVALAVSIFIFIFISINLDILKITNFILI